jgi:hypothetical protein
VHVLVNKRLWRFGPVYQNSRHQDYPQLGDSKLEHSEFSSKQNYILVASPVVGVDCILWDAVPALRNSTAIKPARESEEFEYHWIYNTIPYSDFVSPGWIIWSTASFIKVSISILILTGSKYGRLQWPLGLWTLYTLCVVVMSHCYCHQYIDVHINFALAVHYIVLSIISGSNTDVFPTYPFEENIVLFLFWLLQWMKYTRKEDGERMLHQKPLLYL